MKTMLLALALISVAPLAYAQPYGGPPGPPPPGFHGEHRDDDHGDRRGDDHGDRRGGDHGDWRHPGDERAEWRRREEFREAEYRRMEWRRAHCLRDYEGHEFCR